MKDYFETLGMESRIKKVLDDHPCPDLMFTAALPLYSPVKTWTGKKQYHITDVLLWHSVRGLQIIESPEYSPKILSGLIPAHREDYVFLVSYDGQRRIIQPSACKGSWIAAVTSCDPLQGRLEILCVRPWIQFTVNAADFSDVECCLRNDTSSALFSRPLEYRMETVRSDGKKDTADWMLFCLEAGKTPHLYGQMADSGRDRSFRLAGSMEKSEIPEAFRKVTESLFAKMPVRSIPALDELCERWLDTVPETLDSAVGCLWNLAEKQKCRAPKQAKKQKLLESMKRFILPAEEKEKMLQYARETELGRYGSMDVAWPCLDENENLILICYRFKEPGCCTELGRGICDFRRMLWDKNGDTWKTGEIESCSKIQEVGWLRPFHRKMMSVARKPLADILAARAEPWNLLAECYRYQDQDDSWRMTALRATSFQNALSAVGKPSALRLLLSERMWEEASEVQKTGKEARQKCSSLEELYGFDTFPEWLKTANPSERDIAAVRYLLEKSPDIESVISPDELIRRVKKLPSNCLLYDGILDHPAVIG